MARTLSTALAVAAMCGMSNPAAAKFPLPNDAPPLAVCQDTIRVASLKLASTCRRGVSACLTRGIACVAGPAAARAACCQQASAECQGDLEAIPAAIAKFERFVANRRCGDLPFAEIVAADGLGYESVADACAALVPPGAVADLRGLVDCVARLVVADTSCEIGTHDLPRGAEALACLALESDFHAITGADLLNCEATSPAPSPSPSAALATPTAIATITAVAPTRTATATPRATATATATATPIASATTTATATATAIASATTTATATATPIATAAVTPSPTRTLTAVLTPTAVSSPTPTPSETPTASATVARTTTPTPTPSTTATPTPTPSGMPTATVTLTPAASATPTAVATTTATLSFTPTASGTPTRTATATPSATVTATGAGTPTRSRTPTPTRTPTATRTPIPTPTANCGDGVLAPGEDCDDGNTSNCDACPANCKFAPTACPSPSGVRASVTLHLVPPASHQLSSAKACITYPVGTVALPGTGLVTGRLTGTDGGSGSLNDFNNAVQLSFIDTGSVAELDPVISFDLCPGKTVPPTLSFTCTMKDASDENASPILPASLVECSPTNVTSP